MCARVCMRARVNEYHSRLPPRYNKSCCAVRAAGARANNP